MDNQQMYQALGVSPAVYAFGEQVVDITFAENTALFTDKVKASSGAFVTTVGELKRWPVDINRDGKVNMKDLTRLHQYINGWNVEIH